MDVREFEGLTLPCDNISLRKEKDRLQSELELTKCTISKLEGKISELQNEKSSLTTVIKILHEDNTCSQHVR